MTRQEEIGHLASKALREITTIRDALTTMAVAARIADNALDDLQALLEVIIDEMHHDEQ